MTPRGKHEVNVHTGRCRGWSSCPIGRARGCGGGLRRRRWTIRRRMYRSRTNGLHCPLLMHRTTRTIWDLASYLEFLDAELRSEAPAFVRCIYDDTVHVLGLIESIRNMLGNRPARDLAPQWHRRGRKGSTRSSYRPHPPQAATVRARASGRVRLRNGDGSLRCSLAVVPPPKKAERWSGQESP